PCFTALLLMMSRRAPRSPLFPYTTLFRSGLNDAMADAQCRIEGQARARLAHQLETDHQTPLADVADVRQRTRRLGEQAGKLAAADRKSTRLNSSHVKISYAVFCLKKKKIK